MLRSRRTRILIEGTPELRRSLAAGIEATRGVAEVEAPHGGLVMLRMRETARNGLFNIGELLVTEARVLVEGSIGLGLVAGDDAGAARDLAIIDAALRASLDETTGWETLLEAEEARTAERDRAEAERVARTRVVFDSMDRA